MANRQAEFLGTEDAEKKKGRVPNRHGGGSRKAGWTASRCGKQASGQYINKQKWVNLSNKS